MVAEKKLSKHMFVNYGSRLVVNIEISKKKKRKH